MRREQRDRERLSAIGALERRPLARRQQVCDNVRSAIGEDLLHAEALLVGLRPYVHVPDEGRMTGSVELDRRNVPAEQNRSAGPGHRPGELHRQHPRSALDETAARLEESRLRHGEERPGQAARVVGVIADVPAIANFAASSSPRKRWSMSAVEARQSRINGLSCTPARSNWPSDRSSPARVRPATPA